MKLHKAFTLIELLIVIAIIGILAVALLPAITTGPARARDAARIAAVNDVISAMEQYNLEEGGYPEQDGAFAIDCLDFTEEGLGLDSAPGDPNVRNFFGKIPTVDNADTVDTTALCSDDAELLFYQDLAEDANYMVAVQVERAASANVNDTDAATVRAWTDKSAVLAATDGSALPADDATCPCFYTVVK